MDLQAIDGVCARAFRGNAQGVGELAARSVLARIDGVKEWTAFTDGETATIYVLTDDDVVHRMVASAQPRGAGPASSEASWDTWRIRHSSRFTANVRLEPSAQGPITTREWEFIFGADAGDRLTMKTIEGSADRSGVQQDQTDFALAVAAAIG